MDFYPSDARSLTKTLLAAGKFWTVSMTAEGGKYLHGETKRTCDVLTAAYYVHGVFLDYDCKTNKDIFTQVSKLCWKLYKCTAFQVIFVITVI
jgi:hypothetical protein